MKIAGYDVTVVGDLPDRDTVLIEDAVLLLQSKIDGVELTEIRVHDEGYDLLLRHRGREGTAALRRDERGEWRLLLPPSVDRVVQDLPV